MTGPIASVVVPAHDEGERIASTLAALLGDAVHGEFEVVVVCNGCTDETATIARGVPGVQVEELPTPSKVGALRHGDEIVRTFPRIYLDGDVELSTAAARELVAVLDDDRPLAAGVAGRVVASGSTRPARWYYDFRSRLPVFQDGIIGAGVYAMNAAGRARFDSWPDVLGDDQFVFRTFAPSERVTVRGHHTRVAVDENLATVVRRQLRVRRGNSQLTAGAGGDAATEPPPAGIAAAARDVARRPSSWPGLLTWIAVQALVRGLVRWGGPGDWASDPTR